MFVAFEEQLIRGLDLREIFHNLGWVDAAALGVCGIFCVLGIFKGMIWQVSRVAILVAAYYGALEWGEPLSTTLLAWTHTGPDAPTGDQVTTAQCIAHVLLFLFVLVGLSLLALFLQGLARKAGLGFYDRLFGGALGAATGGLVVLVMMTGVLLFLPETRIAKAAEESHSLRLLQDGLTELGPRAPERLRTVFAATGHHRQTEAQDSPSVDGTATPAEASGSRDGKAVGSGSLRLPSDGEPRDH